MSSELTKILKRLDEDSRRVGAGVLYDPDLKRIKEAEQAIKAYIAEAEATAA